MSAASRYRSARSSPSPAGLHCWWARRCRPATRRCC
ncbi:DUF1156 domain-containing protein [Salinicola sp. DM10]